VQVSVLRRLPPRSLCPGPGRVSRGAAHAL